MRCRSFPRNGDAGRRNIDQRHRFARNKQRADALADRPPRIEQLVTTRQQRKHAITDLGNIEAALQCPLVERLNILEVHIEVEPPGVDLFIDKRVKYKGVVGAGAGAEGEGHDGVFYESEIKLSVLSNSPNKEI